MLAYTVLIIFYHMTMKVSCQLWSTQKNASNWVDSATPAEIFSSNLLEESIESNWWDLTSRLINIAQDTDVDISKRVEISVAEQRRKLDLLIKQVSSQKTELSKFPPAFQWTESQSHIYIQLKLAYRWNSPGTLSVRNENVTLENNRVHFSGVSVQSDVEKLYVLDLELIRNITPQESTWNWGAVGKMTLILKKQDDGYWGQLTSHKIPNMHTWFEMKSKIEQEEANRIAEKEKATKNITVEEEKSKARVNATDQHEQNKKLNQSDSNNKENSNKKTEL